MEAGPPAHLAWRENGEERDGPLQLEKRRMDAARNRIIKTVQMKFPKKSMQAKAFVLNDLVKKVAAKRNTDQQNDECCQVKDTMHLPRNPIIRKKRIKIINGKRCLPIDLKLLALTNYEPAEQRQDVSQAMAGLSCYDKRPREPRASEQVADSETPDPQPDVTRRLEDISLGASSMYAGTGSAQIGPQACDELCQQIVESLCPLETSGFSSRFREYCTNRINPELNASLEAFVAELSRLQRNLYKRDESRGKFKRRYYAGLKENERRVQLNKIKLCIVTPDLDTKKNEGELGKALGQFLQDCRDHEVPVIFGLSRRKLGYLTHGKGFVGCLGVANYQALEEKLQDVLIKIVVARNQLNSFTNELDKKIQLNDILTDDLLLSERVKVLLRALATT